VTTWPSQGKGMLGQYTLDIERILPHILLVSHIDGNHWVGLLQVGSALGNQRSVAWRGRALLSDWRAGHPGQISASAWSTAGLYAHRGLLKSAACLLKSAACAT